MDTATAPFVSSDPSMKGFVKQEAAEFIEFCMDLDSQDDRFNERTPAADFTPRIDPAKWQRVYDSRELVAEDLYNYVQGKPQFDGAEHWARLYKELASRAEGEARDAVKKKLLSTPQWDAQFAASDPNINGFGPWHNAWTLYRGIGPDNGNSYIISIRGTVFSDQPNAAEDFVFQSLQADSFLTDRVQFADDPDAAVHSGFAHATFTLMLDKRYGVLAKLEENQVPAGARLYIVGHSQGAAMATLAHAFLHYAMRNDEAWPATVFKLKGKHYKLKSYVYAQPKPGNYAFSADFARYTQANDNALVINNTIDAVPKVPLTLQAIGDIDHDFKGASLAVRTVHFLSSFGAYLRRTVAFVAEPFEIESAKGYSYFYAYPAILDTRTGDWIKTRTASTWDFVPAGHVIYVYGTPTESDDLFLQHHSNTYRELIGRQL